VPQYLKDEVRDAILQAALQAFAERTYAGATMAEIARAAGVSTGNLYRYFETKEALFTEAVPDRFVRRLHALVRGRVKALAGVEDVTQLAPDARFFRISALLVDFAIQNRVRTLVLLGGAAGSRHEGFAAGLVDELSGLAVAHFRHLGAAFELTDSLKLVLRLIYENLIRALVAILASSTDGAAIAAALELHGRYHLAGLRALFRPNRKVRAS
jgi:AcrR family transcriptional regulator